MDVSSIQRYVLVLFEPSDSLLPRDRVICDACSLITVNLSYLRSLSAPPCYHSLRSDDHWHRFPSPYRASYLPITMPTTHTGERSVTDVDGSSDDNDVELGDGRTSPHQNGASDTDSLLNAIDQKSHQTGKPLHDTDGPLLCFCFDLARLSPHARFILLTVGVSVFFLLNSWVEEYTFKQLPQFRFGWYVWTLCTLVPDFTLCPCCIAHPLLCAELLRCGCDRYLTFVELICFSVFAVIERLFISHEPVLSHTASLRRHGIVAAAMTASRGLTNVSLQYLNYPTQIIFKSMKLITVMIGSLFILRATFTVYEYASAVCLVVAACFFSLGDTDVSVEFPVKGITIVLLSLVGDSLHSNTQDSLLREHKASTSEAMLFTNFFAAVASFVYIVVTGELIEAIAYCQAYPIAYALFVVRSAVIYLGVLCFMLMIKSFGVVTATGVTTVRKIVSILLSFVLFPKAWSNKYWWGGMLFGASLCLSVADQRYKRAKAVEDKRNRALSAASDRR